MLDQAGRARMERVLLAFGAVMLVVAAVFGFGVISVAPLVRWLLSGAFGAAGALEAIIGLRFMGESY